MRAIENKQETYDRLNKIDLFGACFPHLLNQIARGHVWAWDNNAITTELTPAQVQHIEELEERHKDEHLAVYAVLDNHMLLGSGDMVHMESYLFVSDDGHEISSAGVPMFYALADVVNTSWDIHEMGSVIIKRCVAGGPKRVG